MNEYDDFVSFRAHGERIILSIDSFRVVDMTPEEAGRLWSLWNSRAMDAISCAKQARISRVQGRESRLSEGARVVRGVAVGFLFGALVGALLLLINVIRGGV